MDAIGEPYDISPLFNLSLDTIYDFYMEKHKPPTGGIGRKKGRITMDLYKKVGGVINNKNKFRKYW